MILNFSETTESLKPRPKKISFLVAFDKNFVIGKCGRIPWNLTTERNKFKQICSGKKIIMGRKSFDEIGHALPYCTIIIVSKTLKSAPEKCLLAQNLEQAFSFYGDDEEVLVAGGGKIYHQLIEEASTIYTTLIEENYEGDTFFPKIDFCEWQKSNIENHEENGIKYQYFTLTRKVHQ